MKNLSFIFLLFSHFIFSQNHLEPTNSFFDVYDYQYTYYSKIREVLFQGLTDNPKIRMVVIPSFEKEFVFQIEEDKIVKNKFVIIINEPIDNSIWNNNEGNTKDEIKIKTYKSSINEDDLNILYNLLYSTIIKTRFHTDNMSGLDGTRYYLSIWDFGLKSSEIWSPNNKNLKEIIFIMETIVDKAKSEEEISLSKKFKNSILDLTKRANKKLENEEIEFLLKFNQSILEIENQYPELMKVNEYLSINLDEIYNEVNLYVRENGIYYSEIDEIILEHKHYYDSDFFFEEDFELSEKEIKHIEKLIKENSPFLKLIQIYKTDLK